MKLQEKEYEKMFNPQTMGKLKGLSQQAKEKQGAKNYAGETMRLASEIARAERGYQDELEQLAIEVVKDAYPIVDKYNIKIDAKIEPMSQNTAIPKGEFTDQPGEGEYSPEEKEDMDAKRRLINALTQGAGVRGSRSFLLMKDYLDSVDPTLVDKYGKILDVALGGYDDENFIAQILAGIANDNNMPGGSSLPEYDKANKQWIVKARAINFPILIHEIVKGIYSVIGSKGWSKNKALNQASVASVDKLRNEPDDLRYGKFMLDAISDAISKFYNKSNVSDPYVRDVFMAKLVELPYPQLRDFIQNAINGELNAGQERWAKDTLAKISSLKEYKINNPNQYDGYTEELIEFFKKDTLFKGFDKILITNYSKILDNTWKLYNDVYKEFDIDHTDKNIPQNKNELLTQSTNYTSDPFYREVNKFLFPYITIQLKKNGWEWETNSDVFSKDGKDIEIFEYIKPFSDYDTDPRDGSGYEFEEYLDDNWSNIPLNEYKINKPNTQKFKIGDKVKIISQPKWKGEIGNYPVNKPDEIERIDGEYVYVVVIDRPGRRPHMVVSDWFKESELLKVELKEYKVNKPNQYDDHTKELIEFFKKDTLFKGFDKILINNYSKILDNVWEWYKDIYKEDAEEEAKEEAEYAEYAGDDEYQPQEIPQNKNELLTKDNMGTGDSFYRVVNDFLFPYMAVYLKKKDWDWEENTEFSKNGKTVDMFNYIKPFEYDTSPEEMSWSSFIKYLDDNWSNIPLNEYKINKPTTYKFKVGDTQHIDLFDIEDEETYTHTFKILDKRPNWEAVEANPVKDEYMDDTPVISEDEDYDNPYYLIKFIKSEYKGIVCWLCERVID